MPYAYLLLGASCALPLLLSQGSIILNEQFLTVWQYCWQVGVYIFSFNYILTCLFLFLAFPGSNLLCSNSSLPDALVINVNFYHVTSHFLTWEKMSLFYVSLWPWSAIRKRAWFTSKYAAFYRTTVHGRQQQMFFLPPMYLYLSSNTKE